MKRALAGLLLIAWAAGPLEARNRRGGFPLFALPYVQLRGNRVDCTLNNIGEFCVDPTNSSSSGGGFWPFGTRDQYVYNSGIQVAAIIPAVTKTTAFPWPGDTVGAYFFDPRGDQEHGSGLTPVLDGLTADTLQWPTAARANDPQLFAPLLLGRDRVSNQDTWVRYWDGDTSLTNGRPHPAGLLVEQRTLVFRHPALEDAVFVIYRVTNITARNPARYQSLAASGYSPDDIAAIAATGAHWQDRVEARFHIDVPDSGYTLDSMYVSFAQDADVGQAGSNYSNANLVFANIMAYKSDFNEPTWSYPLRIFAPPFLQGPGFVGNAFLRVNPGAGSTLPPPGIAMASNTTGGAPFPDAVGVSRLWRNLSGNLLPSDGSCSFPGQQKNRHFCQFVQTAADTRAFTVQGPLSLAAGQSALIVMAQVHAAAVAAFVTQGGNLRPGYPISGLRIAQGTDTLRGIDRAAGWVSHADVNADGVIDQGEVITTPRSLFWKIQAAQAMLDAGFLQPSAPAAPASILVPGDNQVTVVWEPSATESAGDPYFPVAANPATPLYDPDFRRNDVEGYRVWRGRSASTLQMIAQFDYAGTNFLDYTGQAAYGASPQFSITNTSQTCSPEIGVTTACPAFPVTAPLTGVLVQYRIGDRILLSGGGVGIVAADTVLPGTDTRVPFSFVDHDVRNGESYVYGVSAYDVNSIRSGPSSMESAIVLHRVTPRVTAGQLAGGSLGAATLVGGNGAVLDPAAPLPVLDASAGTFSGPMPPTNALSLAFANTVPQLLGDDSLVLRVDSVVPGEFFNQGRPAVYWFTAQRGANGAVFSLGIQGAGSSSSTDRTAAVEFPALRMGAVAGRFGGDTALALYGTVTLAINGDYRYTSQARALINGDPGGGVAGSSSRWWSNSANENTIDPTGHNCLASFGTGGSPFSCTLTNADFLAGPNAGKLAGVTAIFNIHSYSTIGTTEPVRTMEGMTSGVFRAADFRWYWGAGGTVDSVVDVTHQVRVPFNRKIRASWGILNDSSFVGVVNAANTPDTSIGRLTWGDIACVAPVPGALPTFFSALQRCGGPANWSGTDSGAVLMNHARLNTIELAGSTFAGLQGLTNPTTTPASQTGFILYLNGEFFMMQMAGLPGAGTVWNLRTVAGNITGSPGTYAFVPATRPAAVPGLRITVRSTAATVTAATNDTIFARVHPVPDPYYLTNSLESGTSQLIRFVNLPAQAIVRIYSASGILVAMLSHNDPADGGEAAWDVRSRTGRRVASGVYFWHVEAADGRKKVGRMLVVNRDE